MKTVIWMQILYVRYYLVPCVLGRVKGNSRKNKK